jgi:hypothetical protein
LKFVFLALNLLISGEAAGDGVAWWQLVFGQACVLFEKQIGLNFGDAREIVAGQHFICTAFR